MYEKFKGQPTTFKTDKKSAKTDFCSSVWSFIDLKAKVKVQTLKNALFEEDNEKEINKRLLFSMIRSTVI